MQRMAAHQRCRPAPLACGQPYPAPTRKAFIRRSSSGGYRPGMPSETLEAFGCVPQPPQPLLRAPHARMPAACVILPVLGQTYQSGGTRIALRLGNEAYSRCATPCAPEAVGRCLCIARGVALRSPPAPPPIRPSRSHPSPRLTVCIPRNGTPSTRLGLLL
jgi:hypothetical protein